MLFYGKPLKKLACSTLCCVGAAAAIAGTPSGNSVGGLLGRASGIAAAPARNAASHLDLHNLDLRPPETFSGGRPAAPIGDSPASFPSVKRAQLGTPTGVEEQLPGGSNVATLRMESKVQELERRVPHEGLPLARLWETKTALLHVGLNPKGKPGLWLIQKVP
jgi:hypothetical protein